MELLVRADRMKDAKLEAEQSINTYKADLEAKYQAAFAKVLQLIA